MGDLTEFWRGLLKVVNRANETNTVRRFTQTISARVEEPLLEKLRLLLNKRYNFRKVPMNSLSYVIRRAILLKIRELENATVQ